MSIYPVLLSEWYPPGDEMFGNCISIAECYRCLACGDKIRYKKMVGHHSLPFGHGDVFCNWKCCRSGKIARPDKRRERRLRRKYEDLWLDLKIIGDVKKGVVKKYE